MEINEGYVIRRTILFDNKCGFVLGEDPKAPNPFVTWQFNERDGRRGYFWGHYHNTQEQAAADFQERAESYQRRFRVKVVEQSTAKKETPSIADQLAENADKAARHNASRPTPAIKRNCGPVPSAASSFPGRANGPSAPTPARRPRSASDSGNICVAGGMV